MITIWRHLANRCRQIAPVIALAVSFSLLAHCTDFGRGGTGPDDENPPATLSRIQRSIFNPSCALSPCHSQFARRGDLILTDAVTSHAQLVGILASNLSARAAGKRRVVPFQPDSSFLIHKLTVPGTGEGTRMPDGNSPLHPDSIQIIRDWIALGAQLD